MNGKKLLKDTYYLVKPILPRWFQIYLRRFIVKRKMETFKDVWPIDPMASTKPRDWRGWPDGKKFALVLTHDVDTARGQERCIPLMRLEQSHGFRSSFNFVPKRYQVSASLRQLLVEQGFEVGVHGLYHDGKLYRSRQTFEARSVEINRYLREWQAVGFRSPSMQHNLQWIGELEIEYDASTFDTDPFEPESDGVGTIYPFLVPRDRSFEPYVELPYTLPQDFTLFILMKERGIKIWKRKLEWIVEHGGMVLLNVHPDYLCFGEKPGIDEYPSQYYEEFLLHVKNTYGKSFWHVLPKDMARYWKERFWLHQIHAGITN